MMTTYLVKGEYQDETEVPDPFHGGPENFEKVSEFYTPVAVGSTPCHDVLNLVISAAKQYLCLPNQLQICDLLCCSSCTACIYLSAPVLNSCALDIV